MEGAGRWVVFVSDIPLLPPLHGNRVRVRNMIEALRNAGFRVAYVLWERYTCCHMGMVREIEQLVDRLLVVPLVSEADQVGLYHGRAERIRRRLKTILPLPLADLIQRIPAALNFLNELHWLQFKGHDPKQWCPPRLQQALDVVLRGIPAVAVVVDYVYLTQLLPEPRRHGILGAVDTIDLFYRRYEFYRKQRLQPDWFMVDKAVEASLLDLADVVIAIQPREAEILGEMVDPKKVLCIEHGVQEQDRQPEHAAAAEGIVLVASDNPGNVAGLRWFLNTVWPRVLTRHPSAALHVFGPLSEHPCCRGPRVERHGFVPQARDAYPYGRIAINPLQDGTGLKIKTVEAMAFSRAVVATPVGAEGLEDADGTALRVAEDGLAFANRLCELLADPDEALRLGERARSYAQRRFHPDVVYAPLVRQLASLPARWTYQADRASDSDRLRRPDLPEPPLPPPLGALWRGLTSATLREVEASIRKELNFLGGLTVEFWNSDAFVGGAGLQMLRLARRISALGFGCRLRVPEVTGPVGRLFQAAGFEVCRWEPDVDVTARHRTVVHLVSGFIGANVSWQDELSRHSSAWLHTYQLTFTNPVPGWYGEPTKELHPLWLKASRVTFVSEYDRQLVSAAVGLGKARTCTIWNGIERAASRDTSLPPPVHGTAENATETFVWLWVGRLSNQKRPDLLLDALKRALALGLAEKRKHEVWLLGDDHLSDSVAQKIMTLGLQESVRLMGWCEDPTPHYLRADAVIHTADYEGLPQVIVEAMLHGKPLVTTSAGGICDIVRHEREGLLCPTGDSEAIAQAMLRIATDTALRERLGNQAQRTHGEFLSLNEMAARYALLYLEAAQRH